MNALRFGSVCSGIEAASVAWGGLGWAPAFFSEIEAFPRAVLAERHPHVPLHGDFTTINGEEYGPIDVLVGGTPCQSFSIAGLRGGLADERGNLALEFLRLAGRARPRWLVWENVPGVLSSSGGRDFGAFLGGLVELGYGFAYRVLDAQFFGVPQRRRRVFVVGHLGDWRRAAAVLFERQSLSGDSPPRREAGEDVARPIAAGSPGGSGYRNDADTAENLIAQCLTTGTGTRYDAETETLIAHALRGEGHDASEDGTGRGTPLVPVAFDARQSDVIQYGDKSGPLDTDGHTIGILFDRAQVTSAGSRSNPQPGDPCHTLASEAPMLATTHRVRRLTPRECERLQGFPDDYTLIPTNKRNWRGSVDEVRAYLKLGPAEWTDAQVEKLAADGPRYKAIGNSMAVPVMRWIGERLALAEAA